MIDTALSPRWHQMWFHPVQSGFFHDNVTQLSIVLKGGRSGGTELCKRKGTMRSWNNTLWPDPTLVDYRCNFMAPTRDQAKGIYWNDLKDLTPASFMARDPLEADLTITLKNGATIRVVGMDEPRRVEGRPQDDNFVDEIADMKPRTVPNVLIPMISTPGRPGRITLIGRARLGALHYKRLCDKAVRWPELPKKRSQWRLFTWPSSDILDAEDLDLARQNMDPHTFALEMEARWVAPEGRVYYTYDPDIHRRLPLRQFYDPNAPLIIALDFGTTPGVAVYGQEIRLPKHVLDAHPEFDEVVTAWLGRVYIPRASTTEAVCDKIAADWGEMHKGAVQVFGDETGKNPKSQSGSEGSDWTQVRNFLRPVFGERLSVYVPRGNPRVRDRVNALNARFRSADKKVHMLVDTDGTQEIDDDLLAVRWLTGTADKLDKVSDETLTHLTDAIGYFAHHRYALNARVTVSEEL